MRSHILLIVGPTASGKSSRAVAEAELRGGEVISVDSRQVYRGLDIGTEKITRDEMRGIPHHLIDIRSPLEPYSAGDFVQDATQLIKQITERGKLPILAGGTHFYLDALLYGLPMGTDANPTLRAELEEVPTDELYARVRTSDPERAEALDPQNRRRLIRALEIISTHGTVPERSAPTAYDAEWIIIDLERDELRARLDARLEQAFARGLVDEVRRVREELAKSAHDGSPDAQSAFRGDARLAELGLEYKIVGEFLRGERTEASLLPALSAKLWQYARRQKAWLRKLKESSPC